MPSMAVEALPPIVAAGRSLTPACADTERLDDVCYMNAGWTKFHALMLDDCPMIDAINDGLIGPSGTTRPANPCATNEW